MAAPYITPVALSIPFEPLRTPGYNGIDSTLEALNVQDAIEEAKLDAFNNDRYAVFGSYNGNAITGRYLEFFPGISSNEVPILIPVQTRLLDVVFQSPANSTATLGFFDLAVSAITPFFTISLVNSRVATAIIADPNFPNGVIAANGELAIRITAGNVSKPITYFLLSAAT